MFQIKYKEICLSKILILLMWSFFNPCFGLTYNTKFSYMTSQECLPGKRDELRGRRPTEIRINLDSQRRLPSTWEINLLSTVGMWRSEVILWAQVLFCHCVFPRDQSQILGLDSKHLYLLSHLDSPYDWLVLIANLTQPRVLMKGLPILDCLWAYLFKLSWLC